MLPLQVLRNFRLIGINPLSPIPEIANSATISPELSPEPVLEGSQSSKVISPNMKVRRAKKSINLKLEKKGKVYEMPIEEKSYDLSKKSKKDVLKVNREIGKASLGSPSRPETSRNMRRGSLKWVSMAKGEESKDITDKLPSIRKTAKKNKEGGKKVKEAIKKLNKRKEMIIQKIPSKNEEEVQRITRLILK